MCMGLADLITDAVTYTRLRDGAIPVSTEGAKAAYVAILCFGAATTAVALAYRLHNVRLVRAHLHEFGRQGRKVTGSEARQQAQQHDWEMAQTHRTKVVLSLELLSVAAQGAGCTAQLRRMDGCAVFTLPQYFGHGCHCTAGLPMSSLNIYLIFVDKVQDQMVWMFAIEINCVIKSRHSKGTLLR